MFNKDDRKYNGRKYLKQNVNFIFKCIKCSKPFKDSFHHPSKSKDYLCSVCTKDMNREIQLGNFMYRETVKNV